MAQDKKINPPKDTMPQKDSSKDSTDFDVAKFNAAYNNNNALSMNSIITLIDFHLQPIKDDLRELKGLPVEIAKINTNIEFIKNNIASTPKKIDDMRDKVNILTGSAVAFACLFTLLMFFFNSKVSDIKENSKLSEENINSKLEKIITNTKNLKNVPCGTKTSPSGKKD